MPKQKVEDSPEVQWSGLGTSTAGIMGSIPGRGTRIPQIVQCSHKKGVGGRRTRCRLASSLYDILHSGNQQGKPDKPS